MRLWKTLPGAWDLCADPSCRVGHAKRCTNSAAGDCVPATYSPWWNGTLLLPSMPVEGNEGTAA